MKEYDKIFNSTESRGLKSFQLATGYVSSTAIFFESEKVVVRIEAKGCVEFWNCENKLLASVDIPEQTGGKGTYDEVLCEAGNGIISLKLPIVEWIDNYPNCDGEYDRWDTKVIGCHTVTFNQQTNKLTLN